MPTQRSVCRVLRHSPSQLWPARLRSRLLISRRSAMQSNDEWMRGALRTTIGVVAILVAFATTGGGQPPCETPPPPLSNTNLVVSLSNPPCTLSSCPVGQSVTFVVQALNFDFICA